MRKLFFLIDSPAYEDQFLYRAFKNSKEYNSCIYGIPKNHNVLRKNISYLKLAYKVIINSKSEDDVIVAWFDIIGVYVSILSRLFFKPRKILALNIMIKNKKSFFNKSLLTLYKYGLNNKYFFTTVNSRELINFYNKFLDLNKDRVFYLPDSYAPFQKALTFNESEEFVFCGGRNGRDWELILKIAIRLPNIPFVFVMKKSDLPVIIPPNVKIYHDIPHTEFFKILSQCKILCLPLSTKSPSGIMVIQAASILKKLIISSKTPSTGLYVKGGVLIEDQNEDMYINNIIHFWDNKKERSIITSKQELHIRELSSADKYITNIFEILDLIEKTKY